MKNKTMKLAAFVSGLIFSIFFIAAANVFAANDNNQPIDYTKIKLPKGYTIDDIKPNEARKTSETTKQMGVGPSQPLASGFPASEEIIPSLPLYTEPFLDFKFSFDPAASRTYSPGETFSLKGSLVYSDKNSAQQVESVVQQCQKNTENAEACKQPNLNFPGFNKAGILVQVFRQDESADRTKHGDFMVDEFYAVEDINLEKDKASQFNIHWKVPGEIKEGKYYIALFVNTYNRFGLVDFPINVFSPRVRFDFSVGNASENKGIVIDKSNMSLNGRNHSVVLPVPEISDFQNGVKADIPIKNLASVDQNVNVRYELYRWTEEDPADLLDSKEEKVNIPSGGATTVSYISTPSENDSIYTLKVTAGTQASQTMTNIHWVLKGKNRGILIYLGSTVTPDQAHIPFFCVRNAQWLGSFEGKVKISLANSRGKEVGRWERDASLDAQDRCYGLPGLKLPKDTTGITLKGEILNQAGQVVDEKAVSLDSSARGVQKDQAGVAGTSGAKLLGMILATVAVIILLIILIVFLIKKTKKNEPTITP